MANKRKFTNTEDSTAIRSATEQALQEYREQNITGQSSVSGLIADTFGGSKSKLARALAGLSTSEPLPKKGTPERTSYDSQMKNITRWQNYENGVRGKSARNPENDRTLKRLQDASFRSNPPSAMDLTVTGWIGYDDGDYRFRTITLSPADYPINTQAYLDAMSRGDTSSAWREVFAPYASALHVADVDNMQITFLNLSEL